MSGDGAATNTCNPTPGAQHLVWSDTRFSYDNRSRNETKQGSTAASRSGRLLCLRLPEPARPHKSSALSGMSRRCWLSCKRTAAGTGFPVPASTMVTERFQSSEAPAALLASPGATAAYAKGPCHFLTGRNACPTPPPKRAAGPRRAGEGYSSSSRGALELHDERMLDGPVQPRSGLARRRRIGPKIVEPVAR